MASKNPIVLLMIIALRFLSVNAIAQCADRPPETVSSYTELDVCLTWRLAKILELSVTVQNLLHDQHLEYVNSNPNLRAEIERSVYIKAACRF